MPEERKFSPGPFIKSFLNRSESYPKTKHYSENCYAKVTVILFLNSVEGGSTQLREKNHTESNVKRNIFKTQPYRPYSCNLKRSYQ